MMEPLANVDDAIANPLKACLDGSQEFGALCPEDWRQILDVFELESRVQKFPVYLCNDVSISS